uniref:Uncharacterized protein n=1 Tax=Anguilla anguilla TaxID=7936 RepID=A0A0E9T3U2_ANGAN
MLPMWLGNQHVKREREWFSVLLTSGGWAPYPRLFKTRTRTIYYVPELAVVSSYWLHHI